VDCCFGVFFFVFVVFCGFVVFFLIWFCCVVIDCVWLGLFFVIYWCFFLLWFFWVLLFFWDGTGLVFYLVGLCLSFFGGFERVYFLFCFEFVVWWFVFFCFMVLV